MKNDFYTTKIRFPIVWCKSIVEADAGLFITFVDLLTNEEYEHYQVMPGFIDKGTTKAETYLRKLARAADLEKDYLILDMTQRVHLNDVNPILGRVFRITVKDKKAVKGSRYYKSGRKIYKSAEEIWHYEGDGEFSLHSALYALGHCYQPQSFKDVMLERLVKARSAYNNGNTVEAYKSYYNLH